jgi:hypothetical protein
MRGPTAMMLIVQYYVITLSRSTTTLQSTDPHYVPVRLRPTDAPAPMPAQVAGWRPGVDTPADWITE